MSQYPHSIFGDAGALEKLPPFDVVSPGDVAMSGDVGIDTPPEHDSTPNAIIRAVAMNAAEKCLFIGKPPDWESDAES